MSFNNIPFFLPFQENLLLDTMFEVPGSDVKSVHIDDDCVKGTASPKYVRNTRPLDDATEDSSSSSTANNNDEEEGAQVRVQQ